MDALGPQATLGSYILEFFECCLTLSTLYIFTFAYNAQRWSKERRGYKVQKKAALVVRRLFITSLLCTTTSGYPTST